MKPNRKPWFNIVKSILRMFIRPTRFVIADGTIQSGSIIVCNHSAASAPLAWELYSNIQFRFWGTHEMNSGLRSVYHYLVHVYYTQKKHWNISLARLFCLIAAPFVNMFYRGMGLISTYRDTRFRKSLSESFATLMHGESLVIFPEDSSDGYHEELKSFHEGVVLLASLCLKKNIDSHVYVAYYHRKSRTCYISGPRRIHELIAAAPSRQEIAQYLCDECNAIGEQMSAAVGVTKA